MGSKFSHDPKITFRRKQVRWNRVPCEQQEIGGEHDEFCRKFDAACRISVRTARNQIAQNVSPFHMATLEA